MQSDNRVGIISNVKEHTAKFVARERVNPMTKLLKWIMIEVAIFAVIITGVVAVSILVIRPYMNAESAMPRNGSLEIWQTENGDVQISWPKADRAEYYVFQMYQLPNDGALTFQNNSGELVYEKEIRSGNSVIIPANTYSGNMLFRVTSAVSYLFRGHQVRLSQNPMEIVTRIDAPTIEKYTCKTDIGTQTATIRLEMLDATGFSVYYWDDNGELRELKSVEGDSLQLKFGEDSDLAMPAFGEQVWLQLAVHRKADGVIYYGTDMVDVWIDRAMLVPADIQLEYQLLPQGCRLAWQAEECDYYEIQQFDMQTRVWSTIYTVKDFQQTDVMLASQSPEGQMILRVVAAYEKVEENDQGQEETVVKYRSVSNEIYILGQWAPQE